MKKILLILILSIGIGFSVNASNDIHVKKHYKVADSSHSYLIRFQYDDGAPFLASITVLVASATSFDDACNQIKNSGKYVKAQNFINLTL